MIYIKSPKDIEGIKVAGKISKRIMLEAINYAECGVSTLELNDYIDKQFSLNGATSWFKEIGDYKFATCISVNDAWLHGIPNDYILKNGDVVSIDIGVKKDGYYVDNCWTVITGENSQKYKELPRSFGKKDVVVSRFLEIGVNALQNAINNVVIGDRIGKISSLMQKEVESAGYSVIREYTGHGVGLYPHEDPQIPCYGNEKQGVVIKNGMVLAVEVMYAMKNPAIKTDSDGWTVRSKDGGLTAMFEHTVVVIHNGVELLTD